MAAPDQPARLSKVRGASHMTAQPLWFIDNLVYVHLDGAQTGGVYTLSETWGARGNMPPLHVHHRADEGFYVLEGTVGLFVGKQELVLTAGQAALSPCGVPHAYQVQSDRARWLVVNSPSGYEHFLRAV